MIHTFKGKKSTITTDTWVLELSRKLTNDEWDKISAEINSPEGKLATYDEKGREFSLPMILFVVRKTCEGVEAVSWHHEPINVLVKSMGLPNKVFQIENAMGLQYAIDKAKETWKAQYGYMGMKATIIFVGLATKRDMKGMM